MFIIANLKKSNKNTCKTPSNRHDMVKMDAIIFEIVRGGALRALIGSNTPDQIRFKYNNNNSS